MAITGGILGTVDFVGYSVGGGAKVGHGRAWYGGILQRLMEEEKLRAMRREEVRDIQQLQRKVTIETLVNQFQKDRQAFSLRVQKQNAAYTALLAEI